MLHINEHRPIFVKTDVIHYIWYVIWYYTKRLSQKRFVFVPQIAHSVTCMYMICVNTHTHRIFSYSAPSHECEQMFLWLSRAMRRLPSVMEMFCLCVGAWLHMSCFVGDMMLLRSRHSRCGVYMISSRPCTHLAQERGPPRVALRAFKLSSG